MLNLYAFHGSETFTTPSTDTKNINNNDTEYYVIIFRISNSSLYRHLLKNY